ncbi:MAG: flagellar hook-associated protein FlgL [Clostridiales bacterium]|nr:flagellar hook-associated protein FlgL [Clostridiales bacterium]
MRITNKMIKNTYMSDMTRNLNNMQTLNKQLSSGKEISRPSDNPYKVARSMQLYTDINANKQYNENIKDTINWLDTTDSALNQITNIMQRVRELMVSAGNASYGSDERNAILDEVNERVAEISQVLNTNFDGKYIFGGTKTASKPIDAVESAITGNKSLVFLDKDGNSLDLDSTYVNDMYQIDMLKGELNTEISQGVIMQYNVCATDLLLFKNNDGKSINAIELLSEITNNLNSPDEIDNAKITNENLKGIDDVITNLLKVRAEVGAKQNRMDAAETKNGDETYNMTDILSKTEDIDFTEKTMEYAIAQTVYQASLQVSAQILPQTILDYI